MRLVFETINIFITEYILSIYVNNLYMYHESMQNLQMQKNEYERQRQKNVTYLLLMS